MAEQSPANRRRTLMVGSLVTVVCGLWLTYCVVEEVRYSLYGTSAVAKVTHKSKETRRSGTKGPGYQVLVLDYSFTDASGAQRIGRDEVRIGSAQIPADNTVSVEYIPEVADASRVKGAKSVWDDLMWPGMSLLCSLTLLTLTSVQGTCLQWVGEFLGGLGLFVFGCVVAITSIVVLTRNGIPRDVPTVLLAFAMAVFGVIGIGAVYPGGRIAAAALRPKPQEADLRNASDAPAFSESALVCVGRWLGATVAVIVDRSAGQVHFKECHRRSGFWALLPERWRSIELNQVLRAVREKKIIRGTEYESLIIETPAGTAKVDASLSNYSELCHELCVSSEP